MSMSGIKVDCSIPTLFKKMKMKSINQWAIFKIENKKEIIVESSQETKLSRTIDMSKLEEFRAEAKEVFFSCIASLPSEPRYILYDFYWFDDDKREYKKLVFIFWCSDNEAKIGDKMIYASSKDEIKKTFEGLGIEVQINDKADVQQVYDDIIHEITKK